MLSLINFSIKKLLKLFLAYIVFGRRRHKQATKYNPQKDYTLYIHVLRWRFSYSLPSYVTRIHNRRKLGRVTSYKSHNHEKYQPKICTRNRHALLKRKLMKNERNFLFYFIVYKSRNISANLCDFFETI